MEYRRKKVLDLAQNHLIPDLATIVGGYDCYSCDQCQTLLLPREIEIIEMYKPKTIPCQRCLMVALGIISDFTDSWADETWDRYRQELLWKKMPWAVQKCYLNDLGRLAIPK
jgi:hypothetical protein